MRKTLTWIWRAFPWIGMIVFAIMLTGEKINDGIGEHYFGQNYANQKTHENQRLKTFIRKRHTYKNDLEGFEDLKLISAVSPVGETVTENCDNWKATLIGWTNFGPDGNIVDICDQIVNHETCECRLQTNSGVRN